jgi:hypothetical protein
MRLTDHSGGTAADFNGLSFYPVIQTGHRRNTSCYNTNDALQISISGAAVSMETQFTHRPFLSFFSWSRMYTSNFLRNWARRHS